MPNMDGFEAAAELKQLCPEMKILIVSSDTQAGDALRCRELGLAGHLMKPIRRAELLRQVVKTLSTPQESTPPTRLAGKTHEPERTAGRGVERRILMAEDSEDNRFLLQAYCKGTAYQPSFVENGEEAVLAYQAGGYDMIAMDVHMPVMDGLTAVRRIRAIERKNGDSHIPIVALTANALPRDVQEATEAGCDAHLAKPISRQKLLSALDKWHSGSTLHNSGGAPVSVA
jgi:CheY-like chemotaxis protein